jgi:hypothetical protein
MAEDEHAKRLSDFTAATVRRLRDEALMAGAQQPVFMPPTCKSVRQRVMDNYHRWGADYLWVVKHFRARLGQVRDELGASVPEILSREDEVGWQAIEEALLTFVHWKSYTDTPLSVVERMLHNAQELIAQVSNGGLWQYFYNESGNDWRSMRQLLAEAGEDQSARRFSDCLSIFRDGEPSPDWELRRQELDLLQATFGKTMWTHFERHTAIWHDDPYPQSQTIKRMVHARQSEIVPIWFNENDFA